MKSRTSWAQELDKEWLELIMEAKRLGIELATIRDFFHQNEVKELLLEK
ncbi:DNA-binding anti-repressor SinI [Pseudoneobacillus sp. C159]